jgi:hypothetical protein
VNPDSHAQAARTTPQSELLNPEPRTLNPSRPRSPGRPRALDEIKRSQICALVSHGCGIEGAARFIGCAAATIRREATRNPEFGEALRRAHLSAELAPLQAIRRLAEKYWRAGAWFLERTNPQRFAKQNVAHIKPDQLNSFVEKISQVLTDAIPDPKALRRALRRIDAIRRHAELEIWATKDLPSEPRRSRRPRRRAAPPEIYVQPRQDAAAELAPVASHDET